MTSRHESVLGPIMDRDDELRDLQLKVYRFIAGGPLKRLVVTVLLVSVIAGALSMGIYQCRQEDGRVRQEWNEYRRHGK